jgi:hypothetical protein
MVIALFELVTKTDPLRPTRSLGLSEMACFNYLHFNVYRVSS